MGIAFDDSSDSIDSNHLKTCFILRLVGQRNFTVHAVLRNIQALYDI